MTKNVKIQERTVGLQVTEMIWTVMIRLLSALWIMCLSSGWLQLQNVTILGMDLYNCFRKIVILICNIFLMCFFLHQFGQDAP